MSRMSVPTGSLDVAGRRWMSGFPSRGMARRMNSDGNDCCHTDAITTAPSKVYSLCCWKTPLTTASENLALSTSGDWLLCPHPMSTISPPKSSRSTRYASRADGSMSSTSPRADFTAACSEPNKTSPFRGNTASDMVWPRATTTICSWSRDDVMASPNEPFAFSRKLCAANMMSLSKNASTAFLTKRTTSFRQKGSVLSSSSSSSLSVMNTLNLFVENAFASPCLLPCLLPCLDSPCLDNISG
mmetsp:Transcript_10029/g.17227  ORF Transcript_10029/g.17227 Transcript_10029/m.17227 type:complete len:243 (-) Transcript_10029:438-1166(-)